MDKNQEMLMMRVRLPNDPGSLGAVASAIGATGADIQAIRVVERTTNSALNDFVVQLPSGMTPESMVSVCQSVQQVRVELVSEHLIGGNLQSDLETATQMAAKPEHAAPLLLQAALLVFGADWALLVGVSAEPEVLEATSKGPSPTAMMLASLEPWDTPHLVELPEDPWPVRCSGAVVPLLQHRAMVAARVAPPFRQAELVRLSHLATLAR
jgi:hypothetical protein